MGGSPITLVTSGGIPVTNTAYRGPAFTPVASGGIPATLVASGGMPVTLVNADNSLWVDGGFTPVSIFGTPGAATVGTPYSFTPSTANGSGTKSFSMSGSLPAGLSFSSLTGAITGTPTTAATTSGIGITVTDASGSAVLSGLSIVVGAAATLGPYLSASPAPFAVWGAKRLVSGYNGPLFRLRRADATEQDFAAVNGDLPDYAAIDTFANGTAITVVTQYDQTGGAAHRTQATAANQPSFRTGIKRGSIAPVLIDGVANALGSAQPQVAKTLVAPVAFDKQNFSMFSVVDPMRMQVGTGYFTLDNAGTTYFEMFSNNQKLNLRDSGGANAGNQLLPRQGPQVVGVRQTPTTQSFFEKGTIRTLGKTVVSQAISSITFGKSTAGGGSYNGRYASFGDVLYAAAVSDAEAATVQSDLRTVCGINETFDFRWILSGDSIEEGSGSTLLQNAIRQMAFTKNPELYNTAIHGTTLAAINSAKVTTLGGLYTASVPVLVTVEAGINDLTGGATTAAAYANAQSIITYVKGLGANVKVAHFTLLPHNLYPAGTAIGDKIVEYNSLVRANSAGADYIADQASDTVIGTQASTADTTLYVDGLHPTSLGYARRAIYLAAAGAALLGAAI